MEIESYITGFVDGEGSFLISFSKREKLVNGLEVRPSFTVSQHQRNYDILVTIFKFFECGNIRFNKRDQTYKYEVRNLNDLIVKIIPHFKNYPLQTSKRADFERFEKVCFMMQKKFHLQNKTITKIISLAYQMNNFGARRYLKTDLLKIIAR